MECFKPMAVTGLLVLFMTTAGPAMAAMNCESLGNVRLSDAVINTAELVNAGSIDVAIRGDIEASDSALVQVPDMCRVSGTIVPAIMFEIWLPVAGEWNGRLLATGNGGLAGIINYRAMARAINSGYVTASSDTGHVFTDSKWLSDSGRLEDYGHRATHEIAVQAKAVLAAYYGRSQEYAYFNACSNGGRQGLMEAQRYPDDFDGIISGAPANHFTSLVIGDLWNFHATQELPGAPLSADDLSLVTNTVLESCDANDGVKDGFLTDPRSCEFDPAILRCNGENEGNCLVAAQISALGMLYRGASNPRTGVQLFPGFELGSEGPQPGYAGWSQVLAVDEPAPIAQRVIGGMLFETDDFQWRDFNFDQDVTMIKAKLSGVLDAINPDLRDFEKRGGKLIMYHGWNDVQVIPWGTIDYYESIIAYRKKAMASSDARVETDQYVRLYMMPGMGHCRAGAGPDEVDFMSAIVDWVEHGAAPQELISTKSVDGTATMTRPICHYPQVAVYTGSGDTNDAINFNCH